MRISVNKKEHDAILFAWAVIDSLIGSVDKKPAIEFNECLLGLESLTKKLKSPIKTPAPNPDFCACEYVLSSGKYKCKKCGETIGGWLHRETKKYKHNETKR